MTPEQTIQLLGLLVRLVAASEAIAKSVRPPATPGGTAAGDADLDSQYGNPEVRKDPPRYQGPPCAPCRMSDGSPEWLDELASFKDWQAGKAEQTNELTTGGKPKADYYRLDAARARGWAARIRAGKGPSHATAADATQAWDNNF
jgi:hypothetical protein